MLFRSMPYGDNSILSSYEVNNLYTFLDKKHISFGNVFSELLGIEPSMPSSMEEERIRFFFKGIVNKSNDYKVALPFYLEIQSIFSALIKADKSDAGDMVSTLDKGVEDLENFSHIYPSILQHYLDNLKSQTLLNIERTKIRLEIGRAHV